MLPCYCYQHNYSNLYRGDQYHISYLTPSNTFFHLSYRWSLSVTYRSIVMIHPFTQRLYFLSLDPISTPKSSKMVLLALISVPIFTPTGSFGSSFHSSLISRFERKFKEILNFYILPVSVNTGVFFFFSYGSFFIVLIYFLTFLFFQTQVS